MKHENDYGNITVVNKLDYSDKDDPRIEATIHKTRKLIVLLVIPWFCLCQQFQDALEYERFVPWLIDKSYDKSKKMQFTYVSDRFCRFQEDKCNKLQKFSEFSDIIKEKCPSFYQPHQIVAIDERILKSNNRSWMYPYIKIKPVKLGLQIMVLVDNPNGYKSIAPT